jgi:hydroxymethylpyrimidine/phosphomethylpyrimidine kinase
MKTYARALTVAGSDSGGGAGIQADLKTFTSLGAYGMSVVTALTAQNTVGVAAIQAVGADFVRAQLEAVLGDIGVDAVKTGMLFDAGIIAVVARALRDHGVKRLVVDPVMVAKSGHKLLKDDAVAALKDLLLPMAEMITPNLPEAEVLLGREIRAEAEMERAAKELLKMGPRAVLVKGGHTEDAERARDCLVIGSQVHWLEARRVRTRNDHGTGCTLSAAICAYRALGLEMEDATRKGKEYLSRALVRGAEFSLGEGHGPVYHLL